MTNSEHSPENLLDFLAWNEDNSTLREEKYNDDLIRLLSVYTWEIIEAAADAKKFSSPQIAEILAKVGAYLEQSREKKPNEELVKALVPLFVAVLNQLGLEEGRLAIKDSSNEALYQAISSTQDGL
jgi:hypothetical protein